MTLQQFVKNLKVSNVKDTIKGNYNAFIARQYNKIFGGKKIDEMMFAAAICSDCYLNGACLECGCNFNKMVASDKSCPKNKW